MASPYSDIVLDHFRNPRNVGRLDDANAKATEGSPACGDMVSVYLKVDDETKRIDNITFESYGCASNIATASIITELAKGKTLDEAKKINWKEAADALEIPAGTGGGYFLWIRMKGPHGCADSVDFSFNGGVPITVTVSTRHVWKWIQHQDERTKEPVKRKLAPGRYKMQLLNREDGVEVDQLLLTTSEVVPQRKKEKAPPAGDDN